MKSGAKFGQSEQRAPSQVSLEVKPFTDAFGSKTTGARRPSHLTASL